MPVLLPRQGPAPGRRAAAAVEFAVVSLVFFSLVFATIELGRGLMLNAQLVQAARSGCRAGIPSGRSTADIQAEASAALGRGGMGSTSAVSATVTVLVNGKEVDASTASSGDQLTVTVSVPLSQVTWLPATRYLSSTLAGQYSLSRE